MTRLERVKQALRRGEVCSFADLYSNFLSNGRNDISSLKRSGWTIETTFTKHAAGGASHCHYKLRSEPVDVSATEPVEQTDANGISAVVK